MWRRKMCDKHSFRSAGSIEDSILKHEEQSYGNEKKPVPKYNPDYMRFIREYIR
jgi:hypothetical protein